MEGNSIVSMSNPNLPPYVLCQQCNKIYTFYNLPYILTCNHTICCHCLQISFNSSLKENFEVVEIFCLNCIEHDSNSYQYFRSSEEYAKFLEINFLIDYALISYIYKNYMNTAVFFEQYDITSICFNGEPQKKKTNAKSEPKPMFDDIIIKYNQDLSYIGDIDEEVKAKEFKSPIKKVESIFVNIPSKDIKKYCCFGCQRLFNKRNAPIKMSCKHTICEHCIIKNAKRNLESNIVVFRCVCGSSNICINLIQVPASYSLLWIARKILTIDKNLLNLIYDKVSINAKESAWEFSLRKSPRDPELEALLCCHKCKNPFVTITPYMLYCGHNTCLDCALDDFSGKLILNCAIDGVPTKMMK